MFEIDDIGKLTHLYAARSGTAIRVRHHDRVSAERESRSNLSALPIAPLVGVRGCTAIHIDRCPTIIAGGRHTFRQERHHIRFADNCGGDGNTIIPIRDHYGVIARWKIVEVFGSCAIAPTVIERRCAIINTQIYRTIRIAITTDIILRSD